MRSEMKKMFSAEDMRETRPAMKIGLLATVSPEKKPHITLMSSLMAYSETGLCFGQFTEGLSKKHIQENPKTGFLIMSMQKEIWRGQATYTHAEKHGAEFDYYNNVPMFRYNAYFGVHTVHYLDLLWQSGKNALPMNQIIFAAVKTLFARTLGSGKSTKNVMNGWTRGFLDKLDNLKFLAYIDAEGYPLLIPCIQAQSYDGEHVIFSTSVYAQDLKQIPANSEVCVLDMALTMEDVLLRGKFLGIQKKGGIETGMIKVDWVYNPMPPVPGQIYPPIPLNAVEYF